MYRELKIKTLGSGLYLITAEVERIVETAGLEEALCTVFIQHTSASLIIQENADPSAKRDLERWLDRLVPERDPLYSHTAEGDDDMPAHIKAALTQTTLSIPVVDRKLTLGMWQGIYVWEHRADLHNRCIGVMVR